MITNLLNKMKYLNMLKKDKNACHNQLPKLSKDTYGSNDSDPRKNIPENEVNTSMDYDMEIQDVIRGFDERLNTGDEMEIPDGFTKRTLKLEEEFTHAANTGDVEVFRNKLNLWRLAWCSIMN